jgi:GT2 family glycosyltransferase
MMLDECAVVVATHNRSAELRRTLEGLYELPEQPRLVLVDNASDDDTERVWKPFANRTQFLKLRRNIGAAARTIGAREADTPFVAFCDDDCCWEAGALRRATDLLRRYSDVAVLNGRVVVGDEGRIDPACEAMRAQAASAGVPGIPIVYFMAGACVMRCAAFFEAGGYDARYFIGAEEALLALDIAARGWRLWYCDDLVVRHRPSRENRNADARRRLVLRNRLWTALLRYSAPNACRTLLHYLHAAAQDRVARAAVVEAMQGLPWIVRERRPIPRELEERALRLGALAP